MPMRCQDADPKCPHCAGDCYATAELPLYRVDMTDETGTWLCRECASEAMDSGLFTDEPDDDEVTARECGCEKCAAVIGASGQGCAADEPATAAHADYADMIREEFALLRPCCPDQAEHGARLHSPECPAAPEA